MQFLLDWGLGLVVFGADCLYVYEYRNNYTYPNLGPPWLKSKTCRGFNHQQNLCRSLAPWLPPLLGFIKTSRGLSSGEGIGLIINGRCSSFVFFFFIEARRFFRREDLKDPCNKQKQYSMNHIKDRCNKQKQYSMNHIKDPCNKQKQYSMNHIKHIISNLL
jgi:hypothetical protein